MNLLSNIRGKSRDGFTMVEKMVTMVLLTLVLASSIGFTTFLISANAYSFRLTEAITLAQDKVEGRRVLTKAGFPAPAFAVVGPVGSARQRASPV